ncbi:MAG: efflux RND transporter periplasmic adaptor subunit [candidate division Zixibacteria bacterium]|nr:efflux RND transporter periplasmic adaptor subunit [candidate division Zixibacteria bacterium]
MIKKVTIGSVIVIILASAIWYAFLSGNGKAEDGIKTFPVERGTIIDKALAVGEIQPNNEVGVKSKISGIVDKLQVEVGDYVSKGQALMEIRPDPTPLESAEAQKNVEIFEVVYRNSKKEFDRAQLLLAKKHISESDFDNSQRDYEESELRYKLAKEKLSLLQSGRSNIGNNKTESVIKSPITGTILALNVDRGDPVVPLTSYQAGTELITLAKMDDLVFKGTVDEIDVGKLEEGMTVQIKIGALPDEKIEGLLYKISPKARKEDNTILFDVWIKIIQTGDKMLRAGYSANAEVVINKKEDILVVPERLVHYEGDSTYVEIWPDTTNEETIEKTYIKTGLSDGLNVEVTEGLKDSILVVERPPKEIE